MALPLKTDRQIALIVNSFKKVFETGNIDNLSKSAYDYIYLASGFIAHYNLYGFRSEYSNVGRLANDILNNQSKNQWGNFFPHERDYEYYNQKKVIYNKIVDVVKKYYDK